MFRAFAPRKQDQPRVAYKMDLSMETGLPCWWGPRFERDGRVERRGTRTFERRLPARRAAERAAVAVATASLADSRSALCCLRSASSCSCGGIRLEVRGTPGGSHRKGFAVAVSFSGSGWPRCPDLIGSGSCPRQDVPGPGPRETQILRKLAGARGMREARSQRIRTTTPGTPSRSPQPQDPKTRSLGPPREAQKQHMIDAAPGALSAGAAGRASCPISSPPSRPAGHVGFVSRVFSSAPSGPWPPRWRPGASGSWSRPRRWRPRGGRRGAFFGALRESTRRRAMSWLCWSTRRWSNPHPEAF